MMDQIEFVNVARESKEIDVVKMEFVQAESMPWKDLFKGYEKIYAITYSSGIKFVVKLLDLFEYGEIIFGNDEVMSYNLQEIMAYQLKTIERIRETMTKSKMDLITKIDNEELKLYVARKRLSHEKIYLLESSDGRKRTVLGSANMSQSAFEGAQRENICYIDGEAAFEWYMNSFKEYKEDCSDNISVSALTYADEDENIEELPVMKAVKVQKALIIEPQESFDEDVKFVLDVKNLAKKFTPFVPKPGQSGRTVLIPDEIKKTKKRILDAVKMEKEIRSEYPQLVVDTEEKTVTLNGTMLDLNPDSEEIRRDIRLFIQYMEGYQTFHGDIANLQRRYYEFANWFFASPFMAVMRDTATRYNQHLLPYPVFGLLYGQSKAGKTSFLETLLKMMIGQKLKIPAADFTRSSIESLKRTVQGVPIVVDDLTQARFTQHAIETIKNDGFGFNEQMIHYPAVVISANEDVKAIASEVTRRTIICRVQAGVTNTELVKNNIVRRTQREIGTAFYREYLRRMAEAIPHHLEALQSDDNNSVPDILATSSQILIRIMEEYYEGALPSFIKELTLDDYFNEKITGANAIKTIQNAWAVNKKLFIVRKNINQLTYNAGQVWEADRLIKELPEFLEAYKVRDSVIMRLDRATEFFAIKFRRFF